MRKPKRAWVRALRALTGQEADDIRYNEGLGRWEFLLTNADGIVRSQFWGFYDRPRDPVSGLHPPRELDDDGMRLALSNLEVSYVGNVFDGGGTPKREILKRMKENREEGQRRYKQGGIDFADMTHTVGGRGHRLRGALASGSMGSPAQRSRRKKLNVYELFK